MDGSPTVAGAAVAGYAVMSLLTLAILGFDKRRAANAERRIPERTLHMLELLGGWPGSLLGQQLFRHKRSKPAFFLVTWLIAILHAGCWFAWLRWRAQA